MSDDETPLEPEPTAKPRKERVLHTRVPEVLDQELRRLADSLRVPVSNVVRTILTDALDAMDFVGERAEGEIRGVADRLRSSRSKIRREGQELAPVPSPPPGPPLSGVVGYQPLLLAREASCAVCGTTLPAGAQAFLGLRPAADPPSVIVGPECLPFDPQRAAATGEPQEDT